MRHKIPASLRLLLLSGALAGCESGPTAAAVDPTAPAPPVKALPGLEHFRRWSERVAQGGQPDGDAAFAALAAEGITTVLSVDGALPDLEGATRAGLKSVHVPISYDGIDAAEQLQIIKAVHDSPGPVYVHCHHGLHRGPAAAAIARMAVDGVAPVEAVRGLKDSGCSPAYEGLFRDVLQWKAPAPAALAAVGPLPAAVRPAGVRDVMVHVDERWDFLTDSQAAAWARLPHFPDVSPVHEAGMLREQFRELQRLPEAQAKGPEFLELAGRAEAAAATLEQALRLEAVTSADAAWAPLKQSCSDCHQVWRD